MSEGRGSAPDAPEETLAGAVSIVVLAGGSGTRFWPAGRRHRPKQALALHGEDPRSLLAVTLDRLAPLARCVGGRAASVVLVAPQQLGDVLSAALPPGLHPAPTWLFEPEPKNTAAAVALAAFAARTIDPSTVLLVVPADHLVSPASAWQAALAAMVERAFAGGALVTLGLRPTHAATGFGWLQLGERIDTRQEHAVHVVDRFVEKPQRVVAEAFLAGGQHLWNLGTFAFRADVFLAALARHAPDVFAPLDRLFADCAAGSLPPAALLATTYAALPSISVDHAVMEKATRVETVPASFEWDDLGSWAAVGRHRPADAAGNQIRGDATCIDAANCLVDAEEGHVALLGVENLIVVRTKDCVLVARRDRAEDVRLLVERLKQDGRTGLL